MSRSGHADFPSDDYAVMYSDVDVAVAQSDAGDVELKTVDAVDLLSRQSKPPKFVVRHLVPDRGLVLVSGDTGSLKTGMLVNLAVNVANRTPVVGAFPVSEDAGPVLYFNGEMSNDVMERYLREAVAGNGGKLDRNRFFFEGSNGEPFATFRFTHRPEKQLAVEALIAEMQPSIVIIDTQRAIFEFDENDATAVRTAYNWLRSLCQRFGCSVVLAHHLRKISGQGSNSGRERVSGSRDLIAGVDVHLSVKSTNGGPMRSLVLDKTRTPFEGVMQGTEWAITAQLDMSTLPYRSVITAGEPGTNADAQASTEREDELVAKIEVEAPVTIEQLGARNGAEKRAFDRLREAGTVVAVGKSGRKTLYGLADVQYETDASGVTMHEPSDPTRDPVREKPNKHERLNGVTPDPNQRPRLRAKAFPGPETPVPPYSGDDVSEPSDPASERVGSVGSPIYRDPTRDPTRSHSNFAPAIALNGPRSDGSIASDESGREL